MARVEEEAQFTPAPCTAAANPNYAALPLIEADPGKRGSSDPGRIRLLDSLEMLMNIRRFVAELEKGEKGTCSVRNYEK